MITRRQLLIAAALVPAILLPELWVPKRTIFLPPHGGWPARSGWQRLPDGMIHQWGKTGVNPRTGDSDMKWPIPMVVVSIVYTLVGAEMSWSAIGREIGIITANQMTYDL